MIRTDHRTAVFAPLENRYEKGPRYLADQILATWPSLCNNQHTGLYVVTEDAGYEASVGLWKQTLLDSPRFVNPSPFPFTLSCSPAGYIAQLCKCYGPNYTFVGPTGDIEAAMHELKHDLEQHIIENGILLVLGHMAESTRDSFQAQISIYRR